MRSLGVLKGAMRIEVYDGSQRELWDRFVRGSKNGTFLFYRDYMDYHRDRFQDHSLLVWDSNGHLVALLPADKEGDTLVSHGGLTYGGFITDTAMGMCLMLEVAERVVGFLREQGFRKLIYKAIPHIYHRMPADEDRYALFRLGARLWRRDVTTVVVPSLGVPMQKRRKRNMKKALQYGVKVGLSEDFDRFWLVLEWNLKTLHRRAPTHTVDEIRCLHAFFPDYIKLYCAYLDGDVVAGTVIYETQTVAHCQYIASSPSGRTCGALDLLFAYLLNEVYREKPYFDFGISTESDGKILNEGLVEFKEGFGGRTVTHDFYVLDLQAQEGFS